MDSFTRDVTVHQQMAARRRRPHGQARRGHRHRIHRRAADPGDRPDVAELVVFQRSPAYTLPWSVRALDDGELDEMKARYGEIRGGGSIRWGPRGFRRSRC